MLCQAHDVSEDTSCRHACAGAVALDEHRVLAVTLRGEHDNVIAAFEHIE